MVTRDKEARKISDKQHNLYPKEPQKEQQTKTKASRQKKIIKIRAEINDTETKNKQSSKLTTITKQQEDNRRDQ